jgi:hypothetical protein
MAPLERYRSLAQLSAAVGSATASLFCVRPSNLMVSSSALTSSALYTVNDDAEEGNIALINSDCITIGAGGYFQGRHPRARRIPECRTLNHCRCTQLECAHRDPPRRPDGSARKLDSCNKQWYWRIAAGRRPHHLNSKVMMSTSPKLVDQ